LAGRPITRAHAERTLAALRERIEQANQNPDFLFRITEVVLYGSYLRGSESLADIDIACRLEAKIKAADGISIRDIYREHYRKSGRAWTRMGCEFYWPREEVLLFLKNRQRSISLHDIDDFLSMEKDENFSYEVLLGDADKIENDLKEEARKRVMSDERADSTSPARPHFISKGD
jgi:predicted nucleotidyltransferase